MSKRLRLQAATGEGGGELAESVLTITSTWLHQPPGTTPITVHVLWSVFSARQVSCTQCHNMMCIILLQVEASDVGCVCSAFDPDICFYVLILC